MVIPNLAFWIVISILVFYFIGLFASLYSGSRGYIWFLGITTLLAIIVLSGLVGSGKIPYFTA